MRIRVPLSAQIGLVVVLFASSVMTLGATVASVLRLEGRRSTAELNLTRAGDALISGGSEALACLREHDANLAPSCQQAVAALTGSAAGGNVSTGGATTAPMSAPAVRAAMPSYSPREELFIVRRSCGPDFRALCRAADAVAPGQHDQQPGRGGHR